jgi:uncharacterized protein
MSKQYDVVIVGAGPAGIFAVLELLKNSKQRLDILILEKGKSIDERKCPMREQNISCQHCNPCSLLSGWGGGGAFSDGKLNLTSSIGGYLSDYISEEDLEELIKYVDKIYLQFGADENIYGTNQEDLDSIKRMAAKANLKFIPAKVRHLGTENCFTILKNIYDLLKGKIEIRTSVEIKEVIKEDNQVKGVVTQTGEIINGKYVILSPGRVGAEWLKKMALEFKLKVFNNPVDVGVRVELPAVTLEHLTDVIYESKLIYYTSLFDDKVRTFCMCPHGEVVMEYNEGITTVNGHSYRNKNSDNSNFALLVSTTFTDPFKEPIAYGKHIANLANILSGGVIIQRLGDLISGRRSTPARISHSIITPTLKSATPGDLSFVLPYRILSDIIEMLKALDKIAPGVFHEQTLLYGAEVKFYSARLALSQYLETKVKNLFAIGDGAGITRGLIQASISGVIAAREIKKRMRVND